MLSLREDQIQRYARHIVLPEVGGVGQIRLLRARVCIDLTNHPAAVCALTYIVAAGVGQISLCGPTDREVSANDVALGIAYTASDIGRPRIDALTKRITAMNPDVTLAVSAPGDTFDAKLELTTPPNYTAAQALICGGTAALTLLTKLTTKPSSAPNPNNIP